MLSITMGNWRNLVSQIVCNNGWRFPAQPWSPPTVKSMCYKHPQNVEEPWMLKMHINITWFYFSSPTKPENGKESSIVILPKSSTAYQKWFLCFQQQWCFIQFCCFAVFSSRSAPINQQYIASKSSYLCAQTLKNVII